MHSDVIQIVFENSVYHSPPLQGTAGDPGKEGDAGLRGRKGPPGLPGRAGADGFPVSYILVHYCIHYGILCT